MFACGPVGAEVDSEYLSAWRGQVHAALDTASEAQNELLRQQRVLLDDIRERMKNAERSRSAVMIRSLGTEERAVLGRIEAIESRIARIEKTRSLVGAMAAEALTSHNIRVVRFEGTVLHGDEGSTTPLTDSIDPGDKVTLETGSDGFVELISTDGAIFQVGPGSKVYVNASNDAMTRYQVDHGQIHGQFDCVEVDGSACRDFVIDAGDYRASTTDGELSYQLIQGGERRFFVVEGEAKFVLGDSEMPGIPMNSMIAIAPGGQVHGPMRLNFSWMPLWWRAYE